MKRRRLLKLCLFLLLGAIINVALTWGFAVTSDICNCPPIFGQRLDGASKTYWYGNSRTRLAGYSFTTWIGELDESRIRLGESGPPPEQVIPSWAASFRPDSRHRVLAPNLWENAYIEARGFPTLCLFFARESSWNGTVLRESLHGGIELDRQWKDGANFGKNQILPCVPIWPGFAIDTIFYAAICWLLFAAPFALRRRSRIKRGLCPHCAYRVGTSPVCTECGKPVTPTVAEVKA